jgi:starch phosphorylase
MSSLDASDNQLAGALAPRIAYFSMEIALEEDMPTYAGGLGVLAGDTLRAAADLEVPMVGVTLVHRKGYFRQELDAVGHQVERPCPWEPASKLQELTPRASVEVEGRRINLRAFRHDVVGASGARIAVLLLDSDLPENAPEDRRLTDELYGGDTRYRLAQEVILGIGGIRLLRALGMRELERFHMNEGHAALLGLELLDEQARAYGRSMFNRDDVARVRKLCVFTTHTPVPAGHDKFPLDLARRVLGRPEIYEMRDVFCCEGVLNLTYLALNLSHYVNGVAERHGEVSRHLFAGYKIEAITNGVHAATWAAPSFQRLFDQYLPGWRLDAFSLRYALQIPVDAVATAHCDAKKALLARVKELSGVALEPAAFTIGFGRRATAYKRATLLLRHPERLAAIAAAQGAIQILYAGKAHPRDEEGKRLITEIRRVAGASSGRVRILYLEDYDLALAKLMVAGVDLWLNTPRPPLEASGTSGMKAAINGVPSFSALDGWWLEGHIEGVTGWAIGSDHGAAEGTDDERDAQALYDKLGQVIVPLFYRDPGEYLDIMRHAIGITGSFFNTHRMLQQYVAHAYRS